MNHITTNDLMNEQENTNNSLMNFDNPSSNNKFLHIERNYDLCGEDDDNHENSSTHCESNSSGIISFSSSPSSSPISFKDSSGENTTEEDNNVDIEEESDVLSETESQKEMSPFLVCKIKKDILPTTNLTKENKIKPYYNNSKLESNEPNLIRQPEITLPMKNLNVSNALSSSSYLEIPSISNDKKISETNLNNLDSDDLNESTEFQKDYSRWVETKNRTENSNPSLKEGMGNDYQIPSKRGNNTSAYDFFKFFDDMILNFLIILTIILGIRFYKLIIGYILPISKKSPFYYDNIRFLVGDKYPTDNLPPTGKFIVDFDKKVAIPYNGNLIEYNFDLLKAGTINLFSKSCKTFEENYNNGYDKALELSGEIMNKYNYEHDFITKLISHNEEDISKRVITLIQHIFN
ncbi:hypothetical protein, no similarity [Maudiozyma saulgeensis]|uniref:Uncharacterized protein n=1 Tax=Maudiozyma saulgeensis TaxID=1789683 RepID=A0A1X7R4H2_9SACH|nr:hypothetical protein, no similarity [Kazachstania saulgeensis]